MKLSVLDRILLFLSMLFMLAIGVGVAMVCTSITSFVEIARYIELNLNDSRGILILVAVSAVIILVAVKLILALFVSSGSSGKTGHESNSNVTLKNSEDGDIMVSSELIKDIAVKFAKVPDDVKDVDCKVICGETGVKILMKFYLKKGVIINDFLLKMQTELKDYVEKYVGVTIQSVDFCADVDESGNASAARVR